MTQIKYYSVDTGFPISEKHVLRVKENNGQYSVVVMDMHFLTVERSDWYASVQDFTFLSTFISMHISSLI